jgi:hypothetical protein
MPFFAASEALPRPESMKFPVFSLLAGNLAFSETSSQLTPPSSGESAANPRKPDDLEAQEGQRTIAVHALENLATSDTGHCHAAADIARTDQAGERRLDPMNVIRGERLNRTIPTNAWNTILSPAEVISALEREGVWAN